MRRLCVVLLVGLGTACNRRDAAQSTPAPVPALATTVYAAVLESDRGLSADTLLVADSTSSLSESLPGPGYPLALPQELVRSLVALTKVRRPTSELPLPPPVRILTQTDLDGFFGGGRGPAGWQAFYQRFPRRRGFYRFSPVAFTADSLGALVYVENHCGGLCGSGNLVWLTRERDGRLWLVRERLGLWVS